MASGIVTGEFVDWKNPAILARLTKLWVEGLSYAEIATHIGTSKNAIISKAHRLGLPARPSPIRRDGVPGAPKPPAPRRAPAQTLPSLACVDAAEPTPQVVQLPETRHTIGGRITELNRNGSNRTPIVGATLAPLPSADPAKVPARQSAPPRRTELCCWPLGEPRTKSFRFCDCPALPSKPYCEEHAQAAYVRVRDRREDDALGYRLRAKSAVAADNVTAHAELLNA